MERHQLSELREVHTDTQVHGPNTDASDAAQAGEHSHAVPPRRERRMNGKKRLTGKSKHAKKIVWIDLESEPPTQTEAWTSYTHSAWSYLDKSKRLRIRKVQRQARKNNR